MDHPFDVQYNVKDYITSPGNAEGGVDDSCDVKRILRYTTSERGTCSGAHMIGKLVFAHFGAELVRYCHFGTESSIMDKLMEKMTGIQVDFRAILGGCPIYNTKKHLEKLGLQAELPGLCTDGGQSNADVFMRPFVEKSANGGVGSEGSGVKLFALLTAASLVGTDHIHCKSSSRISQSILKLIMKSAPVAVGNYVPLRSFHEQTREVEVIVVNHKQRPENFVRPIDDDLFANTGVFSYCAVDDGDMPEDYIGLPVREQAKFLKCKYVDVPADQVYSSYQLVTGRFYSIYSKSSNSHGSLIVNDGGVFVQLDSEVALDKLCNDVSLRGAGRY